MLFNTIRAHTEEEETYYPRGWVFDWDNNSFEMETGTPVEAADDAAARYFVQLLIRTRRGRYAIYPSDFGCRLQDIRGHKIRKGAVLADLQADLRASSEYCDLINDIGSVTYDGELINIEVTLQSGQTITVEVDGNG